MYYLHFFVIFSILERVSLCYITIYLLFLLDTFNRIC